MPPPCLMYAVDKTCHPSIIVLSWILHPSIRDKRAGAHLLLITASQVPQPAPSQTDHS